MLAPGEGDAADMAVNAIAAKHFKALIAECSSERGEFQPYDAASVILMIALNVVRVVEEYRGPQAAEEFAKVFPALFVSGVAEMKTGRRSTVPIDSLAQ